MQWKLFVKRTLEAMHENEKKMIKQSNLIQFKIGSMRKVWNGFDQTNWKQIYPFLSFHFYTLKIFRPFRPIRPFRPFRPFSHSTSLLFTYLHDAYNSVDLQGEAGKHGQKCGFVWWREISCENNNNFIVVVVVVVVVDVKTIRTVLPMSTKKSFWLTKLSVWKIYWY